MAYEKIGMSIEGEPIEPEQTTVALRHLNVLIKHWAVKGFHLWKRERQSISLVASQTDYTLGQKAAGTTTATTANKLVDSGADFVSDVSVGDTIYDLTGGSNTTISAIDSTTILSVASDIFTNGDKYEITSANVAMPRPDRILECNRKTIAEGIETTVNPLSLQEYENLPNKSDTGTPVQYFYDPTLNNGTLRLWLTPDAQAVSEFTIEVVVQSQVNDIDAATDDLDFPQEWYLPLIDNLAYELSKIYGSARLGELRILKNDAQTSLDDAANFDQDSTSVYFQPDFERQS